MTPQELASALIRVFEGCRLTSYRDTGGVWTIGFGHTGPDVVEGLTITQDQADAFLAADSTPLFTAVAGRPVIQQAALVSFGYNCGLSKLEEVLAGHSLIGQFVHDRHGNVLPGLEARRALEEALVAATLTAS